MAYTGCYNLNATCGLSVNTSVVINFASSKEKKILYRVLKVIVLKLNIYSCWVIKHQPVKAGI